MAIKLGKVVSTVDDTCSGRIKVIIKHVDGELVKSEYTKEDLENVPWCLPLLPKMLNIIPKPDEMVYVLTPDENCDSRRYYIGPIISQPEDMYFENQLKAESFMSGGEKQMEKSVCVNGVDDEDSPSALVPKTTDVALEGRKNCGLQLTDNTAVLKCGVKNLTDTGVNFNSDGTSSYLLFKYDENKTSPPENMTASENAEYYKSTANIVADKINLLGNRQSFGTDARYSLDDIKELINDESLNYIIQDAQQVPLGNKLIEFLILLTKCLLTHVHPFPLMTPVVDNTELSSLQAYLDVDGSTGKKKIYSILSDNVRIN